MRRMLVIAGVLLLGAAPAMAQNALKIRIDEVGQGTSDVGAQVRTELLPMVSANPHYTLVSDTSWDLHLIINCLYATTGNDSERIGVNCADEIVYQPDKWGGLIDAFGPYIGMGPDEATVAKEIFADFLDETTVDKIKSADDYLSQMFDGIYKVAASNVPAKPCTAAAPKRPSVNSNGQPAPN